MCYRKEWETEALKYTYIEELNSWFWLIESLKNDLCQTLCMVPEFFVKQMGVWIVFFTAQCLVQTQ